MSSERLTTIRAAAERVAQSYGLEIFDVQLRRESIGWVLRVMIDRPDRGVPETAGRRRRHRRLPAGQPGPERAARRRRRGLGEAALGQHYTLEVSSPGLDRPLRDEADYRRFAGRLAKIVTTEPVDGQSAFAGHGIAGVEDGRRWCSKKAARRTGCRSPASSAGAWKWSFRKVVSAVSLDVRE